MPFTVSKPGKPPHAGTAPQELTLNDSRTDDSAEPTAARHQSHAERHSAWERALQGPPINPNSDLIYHDGKTLQSRHS